MSIERRRFPLKPALYGAVALSIVPAAITIIRTDLSVSASSPQQSGEGLGPSNEFTPQAKMKQPVTFEDLERNLVEISTPTPIPPTPTLEPTLTPTPAPTETPVGSPEISEKNEVTDITWMPDSVKYYSKLIVASARKHNVDPKLIASLILVESCGYQYARSYAGAEGPCQIMPDTAPNIDRYDDELSIEFCCSYLATLYKSFNNWSQRIALITDSLRRDFFLRRMRQGVAYYLT